MKLTDFLQNTVNFIYSKIPQNRPSKDLAQACRIIAHRGAWNKERLENTIPAFDKCLQANVWAIEFDIQWTKDNIPIIHHDKNTYRVFKKNIDINNTTFSELRKTIPQIPSFQEVIKLYGKKIHLMIELKAFPSALQLQILKELLKNLTSVTDYHFMSLDIKCFKHLDGFNAQSFVAIGRSDLKEVHNKSLNIEIGALTGHYLLFHKKMQSAQHNLGRKTGVGFPNSKNGLYREINNQFSWIFTNHPLLLQSELNQLMG